MLFSRETAAAKRRRFREALASGEILRLPGAFNPLSARLIEDKGFDGVYVSGAVLSADLGLPDIGLTTLSEVAGRAAQIARVTDLPTLVDADTGFGEPMNVARTVQTMEDAGVAGMHLEHQVNPTPSGHVVVMVVVERGVGGGGGGAAVDGRRDPDFLVMARTDVRGTEPGERGLRLAIDRAKALADAGADAIFPEAMRDLSEFEAVASALDVPVLANMTEFGKSELFTVKQLADAGARIVIYPVTLLRMAMGAAERTLDTLNAEGTQTAVVGDMQTRARLYELVDYAGYNHFDSAVFTYEPGQNHQH
jgi:methylisocitrate lyase